MKILIVSEYMPSPVTDGMITSINYTVRYLSSKYSCSLVASYGCESEIEKTQLEFPQLDIIKTFPRRAKKLNRINAILTKKAPATKVFYNRKLKNFVKLLVSREKFDLLLFYPLYSIFYLPDKCNVPTILSVNDAFSLAYERRKQYSGFHGIKGIYDKINLKYFKRMERKDYEKFDCIHVVSPVDKAVLQENNPKLNVVDIPLIAPRQYFAPRIEHEKLRILFCENKASTEPLAGLKEFLQYSQSFLNREDIEIVLIYKKDAEGISAVCNNYCNVRHEDYIFDFAGALLETDIVVAFDKIGAGMKNRIVQSMAAGCCVVATPIAMEGFKFENGTHAYCENTVQEISQRVKRLVLDRKQLLLMSENARANALQYYSYEAVCKDWLEVVQKTVENANKH